MDHLEPLNRIEQGLELLPFSIDSNLATPLLRYAELLVQWNKKVNLTAITSMPEVVDLHLLDSLTVLPYVAGERIADIGCGGGLPGIPLALAMPDRQFLLVDAVAKKTHFLRYVVASLGLKNVEVRHSRSEDVQVELDSIVTRAFAPIPRMLEHCGHLLLVGSRLLAMKGVFPEQEIADLPAEFGINAVLRLEVPGRDIERHLIEITRL